MRLGNGHRQRFSARIRGLVRLPRQASARKVTSAVAGRDWAAAQAAELEFWVHYVRDELGVSNRDQLVGYRLCEGRIHLFSFFGYEWNDWIYSESSYISGKLLDVGSALVSVFEKCRSVRVVAIDPLLKELRRRLPQLVVIGRVNNCEYRCCRIQDVAERDFDVVWCNNVLDHTDDWPELIRHFSRVLKPSGRLFLGTDVRQDSSSLDSAHISAFTAEAVLNELAVSGFRIEWQSACPDLPKYRFSVRAIKAPGVGAQVSAG